MWRRWTHECYLKGHYEADGERKNCPDCLAYESEEKVLDLASEKTIPWGPSDQRYHPGDSWTLFRSQWIFTSMLKGKSSACTIVKGFDQPEEYNIGEPFPVEAPDLCCSACGEEKSESV